MERPVGVTILSVLDFFGAAVGVLFGILSFVGGGLIATVLSQSQGSGAGVGAGILAGLGAAVGIVILFFGAIYALVGWGMWKLKSWARIVTIIFAALGVLGGALGLFGALSHFHVFALVSVVIRLAIAGLILWYMFQPNVKAAFGASA